MLSGSARAGDAEAERFLGAAMRLHEDLEYERALEAARNARKQASSPSQQSAAALLEGVILSDLNRKDEAKAAFQEGLYLDPDAALPLRVAPRVASVFEALRTQVKHELAPELARREAERVRREQEARHRQETEAEEKNAAERSAAEARARLEAERRARAEAEETARLQTERAARLAAELGARDKAERTAAPPPGDAMPTAHRGPAAPAAAGTPGPAAPSVPGASARAAGSAPADVPHAVAADPRPALAPIAVHEETPPSVVAPAPSGGRLAAAIGLGAGALASLAGGIWFGLKAQAAVDTARNDRLQLDAQASLNRANDAALPANVLYGVAGALSLAALGAGVAWGRAEPSPVPMPSGEKP